MRLIELERESKAGPGRGVRVTRTVEKGQLLDEAPVTELPLHVYEYLKGAKRDNSTFANIVYEWPGSEGPPQGAIAFGLCSLCQHSNSPNAKIEKLPRDRMVKLLAIDKILEGDEVTIRYANTPYFGQPM